MNGTDARRKLVQNTCDSCSCSGFDNACFKVGFTNTPGADHARVASQVIPGIGLAIGAGMYLAGIFSAILIVLIEAVLHRRFYFGGMRASVQLELEVEKRTHAENNFLKILEQHHLMPSDIQYASSENDNAWIINIDAAAQSELDPDELLECIRKCNGVMHADVKHV